MSQCEKIIEQMSFYLDDELHDSEYAEVERHLSACAGCSTVFEQESSVLEQIRNLQPLYHATPELRARIEGDLSGEITGIDVPQMLRARVQQTLSQLSVPPSRSFSPARVFAMAMVLLTMGLAGYLIAYTQRDPFPPTGDFARMAVDTHQRRINGQLPLEIEADSPSEISSWFAGKVSFSLELPNYQEASGQEKLYRLEGARLVAFNNDYAAFVAYRMHHRPITLVATSNAVARPVGGEEIATKGLTFHYQNVNGFKLITWTHRGLTYALVSDLEERGQQSCLVCHAGTKDRDFIEDLKIKL